MNVLFTDVDTSYACDALGRALQREAPLLQKLIGERYGPKEDGRTLAVLFTCPCCTGVRKEIKNAEVIVGAFWGISPGGLRVDGVAAFYPPYKSPGGERQAKTSQEYQQSVVDMIDKLLQY